MMLLSKSQHGILYNLIITIKSLQNKLINFLLPFYLRGEILNSYGVICFTKKSDEIL